MPFIVLNEEQTQTIVSSLQPIQVRDPQGKVLGILSPIWSEQDLQEARHRLAGNEPRFSTEQVINYLGSLEKK